MAEDEWDLLLCTEVGQPVPGEGALDGYGDVLTIWSDDGKEGIGIGWEIFVNQDLSDLVEDADIQGSGVEIDPTVVLMLCGIESHEAFSFRFSGLYQHA
jgi:hypothetical protein